MLEKNLIDEIKRDEGFEPMPYKDTRGYPTIGYGTKLPIDEIEATLLLEKRLHDTLADIRRNVSFYEDLPKEAQLILLNMGYNLGVPKLMGFKKMWAALDRRDFKEAAKEMRDSLWYNQVGDRAERLAQRMENITR